MINNLHIRLYPLKLPLLGLLLLVSFSTVFAQKPISKDSIIKLLPDRQELSLNRHNFDSAKYVNFSTLITHFNSISDKHLKAEVASSIAHYYLITADVSSSQKYFKIAMDQYEELGEWKLYIKAAKDICSTYFYQPNLKVMDSILTKALTIADTKKVGHYILNPLQELTVFNAYFKHDFEKSIEYGTRFFEELAIYTEIEGDEDLYVSKVLDARIVDVEMGHSYVELGQLALADFHLKRAEVYFLEVMDNEKLYRLNQHLSKLALKRGETEKLMPLYNAISENFDKNQEGNQSNFTQAHSQVVKRIALEQQVRDREIRIAKLRQDRQVLGFLIVSIIICSLIGIWWALKAKKLHNKLNIVLQTQVKSSQKLNEEKSKYFAILSHELRTPIFAITGLTELLRKGQKLDEDNINAIISSGEFLLQLVNNILQLNKIEGKPHIKLNEGEFNLLGVLNSVMQSLQYYATQKNVALVFGHNLEPDEIVMGDKQKIEQVFANLLSNAIKYTNEEGKVTLIVNRNEEPADQSLYHFKIMDDGIGIKQAELQAILNFSHDNFDTLVNNDRLKTKGIGIGLYIVSRFLEAMNSKLNIGSTPNEGTSFFFDLRLKNSLVNKRDVKNIDLLLENSTVLVVDDNKLNLLITQKLLLGENINCFTASDTDPLISLIQENNVDIMLIDLLMPEVDGFEWVKRIRKEGITIPILAHTASANEDIDMEHLHGVGFQGVVVKPYLGPEIKEKLVTILLERKQAFLEHDI